MIREYNAGENNHFVTAKLDIRASQRYNNDLSISYDNKTYIPVKSNLGKEVVDISKFVKGKSKFYLKLTISRKTAAARSEALIHFRLDYTKANPDVVAPRKKLEIGTGWLDFKPVWYFRKDVKNKGLSKKEMDVKSFSPKGWTQVTVPAKLEATAHGPYLGYGWYSTVFDVRKDWQGRSIDILVGAVDEQAWVYFNGHYVGEHTVKSEKVHVGKLYNEPFIIRVPAKYINTGGKNLLQIKIHASFGASGIWKPVKIRPVDASVYY